MVHLETLLRSFSPPCLQARHFQSFSVATDQDMNMHSKGDNWLGSRTALKKPVVIMDHKLNLSQHNKDNTSQKYLIRLFYVGHPWQLSCSTQSWWNLSWNIVSNFRHHIKNKNRYKPAGKSTKRATRRLGGLENLNLRTSWNIGLKKGGKKGKRKKGKGKKKGELTWEGTKQPSSTLLHWRSTTKCSCLLKAEQAIDLIHSKI